MNKRFRIVSALIFLGFVGVLIFQHPDAFGLHESTKSSTAVKIENIEWAFTKADQHPEALLIQTIDSAQKSIDVAIYSLTHPEIVNALKQAHQRGIEIRMIVDRSQSEGKAMNEALKILGSAGISMKTNQHSGLMHLKMIIVDQEVASTGSFNFSKAAATRNDEIVVLIKDNQVADSFTAEFDRMWHDQKSFVQIRPVIAN
ncbi:phospholipase D-like domain-containing protein [Paenibacillus taichungensis]|uniref:phospholipase D-like domain-containing protein n=1 Tax=Paenibacillus taichungensis TaxID=484184 RepID=UPI0035D9598C